MGIIKQESNFYNNNDFYNNMIYQYLLNHIIIYYLMKEFSRKQNNEKFIGYKKYNSYTADAPREEYQLDVAYMKSWLSRYKQITDLKLYPYCLVCIDIFSKKVNIEALKDLTADDTTAAFAQCVKTLLPPKYVYTDDGVQFKNKFKDYCKIQGIEHLTAYNAHAPYAESLIYDMKLYFLKKAEEGMTEWTSEILNFNKKWNETPKPILKLYDTELTPNMVHNDIRYAPLLKDKYMNNSLNKSGNYPRKYPNLEVDDKVYIWTGGTGRGYGKYKFYNQGRNKWSSKEYTIRKIESIDKITYYYVDDLNKKFLRFQLFKIK